MCTKVTFREMLFPSSDNSNYYVAHTYSKYTRPEENNRISRFG